MKKFDNGQLRGAYSAGKEAGFKEAMAQMRLEGWRKVKHAREIQDGDLVRLVEPTIFGWTGKGIVYFVGTPNSNGEALVLFSKLEDPEQRVSCVSYELAKKYVTSGE